MRSDTRQVLNAVARNFAGLAVFFATWIVVFAIAAQAGSYWFWLGLLFGWLPAIAASNLVEKAWPVFVLLAIGVVAWRMLS